MYFNKFSFVIKKNKKKNSYKYILCCNIGDKRKQPQNKQPMFCELKACS